LSSIYESYYCNPLTRFIHSFPTTPYPPLFRSGLKRSPNHSAQLSLLPAWGAAPPTPTSITTVVWICCSPPTAARCICSATKRRRSEEHTLNSSHGSISYAVFFLRDKR